MPARPRRRPVGKFIALPRRGQTERAASAVSLIRRVQRYSRYARGGGGRGGRVSGSTPFPPTVTSPAGWKCYNEWNDIKEKSELFFLFLFFLSTRNPYETSVRGTRGRHGGRRYASRARWYWRLCAGGGWTGRTSFMNNDDSFSFLTFHPQNKFHRRRAIDVATLPRRRVVQYSVKT